MATPIFEKQLKEKLDKTLEAMVGHPIIKPELDLIVGIATEMLKLDPKNPTIPAKEILEETLTAATVAAKLELTEMRNLQQECNTLLDNIIKEKDKEEKDDMVFKLQKKMTKLAQMDPDKARGEKMAKLISDPKFINNFVENAGDILNKWKKDDSAADEDPDSKKEAEKTDSPENQIFLVEKTMEQLLGLNPRTGQAVVTQSNMGNELGIVKQRNDLEGQGKRAIDEDSDKSDLDSTSNSRPSSPFAIPNPGKTPENKPPGSG